MGIQINGATDSITAIDGTIDVVSAIGNAGVVTATAFVGNITGNVTGNINHTGNLELQTGGVTRAHFNPSGHFAIAGITTISHTGANQLTIKDSDTSGNAAEMRISFKDSGNTERFYIGNNESSNSYLYLGSPSGQNNNVALTVGGSTKLTAFSGGIGVNGDLELQDTIYHAGDTDTKIRFPGADTFSVETAGDERVRITSDGTIKVKDSAVNLDGNAPAVKGKIRIGGVSDLTTAGGIEFHTSSGGGGGYGTRITSDASANMHFLTRSNSTNWSERLRIASDGDLTITGSDNAELKLKAGTSSGNDIIAFQNSSGATQGNIFYDTDHNFMVFKTNGTASSNERLRITSTGEVGINTTVVPYGNFAVDHGQYGLTRISEYSHLLLQNKNASTTEFWNFAPRDDGSVTIGRGVPGSGTGIITDIKLSITSTGNVVVGGTSAQTSDAVTLMTDGEVTAAGFYFSNNIGSAMNACGIRRHTTNTMVFDTASTERLRIDADGNTSTKGSAMEHFVNKRVQSINSNGNSVQYVLVAPTGTNNLRLQGKFHFTRATGTSGIAQQTVDAQIMTNNTGGDAQYYVRTASTDEGSYSGIYYRWVTCDYNSTTYYALEGHPVTGSSYWGGYMQHGVYTGTANQCTNLGTVLNTTSHSITNITALTARKAHERWYNTNLNVQAGALYVKQASGLNGGYFAPLYYDTNGAALPTQMKVHGQKAVCIDATRYYTSGDIITFRINNDYEGAIYVSPSGVNYNSTSDYRLKENVIDLTGAIDRVKQLKPKRFNFIKEPGNTMDGFMAHEVSGIVPNAVMGEKDAVKDILYEENDEVIPEGKKIGDVKEKNAIDPQTMDDSKLVPLLTAALQEAIAKIETLETKVAALEGS